LLTLWTRLTDIALRSLVALVTLRADITFGTGHDRRIPGIAFWPRLAGIAFQALLTVWTRLTDVALRPLVALVTLRTDFALRTGHG
jgi:hypothetical protein